MKFIFGFITGIVMGALFVVSTITAFLAGIAVATCGDKDATTDESATPEPEEAPVT